MIQFCGPERARKPVKAMGRSRCVAKCSLGLVAIHGHKRLAQDPQRSVGLINLLHDLILRETASMLRVLHRITSHCHVPDEVKTEGTPTVLVTCEFG